MFPQIKLILRIAPDSILLLGHTLTPGAIWASSPTIESAPTTEPSKACDRRSIRVPREIVQARK